jgi:teichuronic acid biosynthesis glycosyltransferase TuaG
MANIVVMLGVFNVEKTIKKTLDSIINQNFPSYEIIVSENHSTDLTKKILDCYLNKITLISPPTHLSANDHGNFCLEYLQELKTADYAALFHGDDVYDSEILKLQVEFLDQNLDTPLVFTDVLIVDENYSTIGWSNSRKKRFLYSKYTYEEVLYGMISSKITCMCPTVMMRLDILRKKKNYRFNSEVFLKAADYGLWLEIIRDYNCVGILHKHLVKYRKSSSSDSASVGISLDESPAFKVISYFIGSVNEIKYLNWHWRGHIQRLLVQDYFRRLKNEINQKIISTELTCPKMTIPYILVSFSSLSGLYNLFNLITFKYFLSNIPSVELKIKLMELLMNQEFIIFTRRIRHFLNKIPNPF